MASQHSTGKTTFTTPSDTELVATRIIAAPRRLVWEAHANPAHVPQWMLGMEGETMTTCDIDLRPGGSWHFVWREADGSQMERRGVYREVVWHERLVNTEAWGGDWAESLNTLTLTEEEGGKTRLEAKVLYPSKEARDRAIGTGMKDGWSAAYDRLEAYLTSLTAQQGENAPSGP